VKTSVQSVGISPIVLRMRPAVVMDDDQFFEFCQLNRDLRLERTPEGDIQIMSPSGGESSARNAELMFQLMAWAKKDGTGKVFDSSVGFVLSDGAVLSPDAAWTRRDRLAKLTRDQKRRFLPVCPDFVVELRSPTDRLAGLKEKMEQYIRNGARLGWLIEPEERIVFVYRPDRRVEQLDQIMRLAGDPELPGFVLELAAIWNPEL
jgi:Uma2 family endonuclease